MKKLFISFSIALSIILLGGFYLYSRYNVESPFCTVNIRAPWYTIYIEIDESTIPPGIQHVRLSEEEFAYGLVNTTDSPLYLVTDYTKASETYSHDYPESELPALYIPFFKATKDKILYYVHDDDTSLRGWQSNAGNRISEIGHVIEITPYLLERMGNELKNVYLDNRPDDITLPQNHPIVIKAYYKNTPLEISGKAIYQRNTRYDEMIAQKKLTNCQRHFLITDFTNYLLISLRIGLIFVLANIVAIAYYLHKKIDIPMILYILPILYVLISIVFFGIAQFVL